MALWDFKLSDNPSISIYFHLIFLASSSAGVSTTFIRSWKHAMHVSKSTLPWAFGDRNFWDSTCWHGESSTETWYTHIKKSHFQLVNVWFLLNFTTKYHKIPKYLTKVDPDGWFSGNMMGICWRYHVKWSNHLRMEIFQRDLKQPKWILMGT